MTASPLKRRRRALAWLAAGATAGAATVPLRSATPPDVPPSFSSRLALGLVGDTPYFTHEIPLLHATWQAMAQEALSFVIHVGDIQSGGTPCSRSLLGDRIALLDACTHPLIYTPGDNEWTDCHRRIRPGEGAEDQVFRQLHLLRSLAFANPSSLGQRRMALEQQGPVPTFVHRPARALPENLRWRVDSLQCLTLHVTGSNNGRGGSSDLWRRPEWKARQEANAAWLADTVRIATQEDARGLLIALHANLRWASHREGNTQSDGWAALREQLIQVGRQWQKPILLLHGDTHWFRVKRPLSKWGIDHLLQVESFGSPLVGSWIRIDWNPDGDPDAADPRHHPFFVSTRELTPLPV